MSSLAVFVGLDYHQDSVQVCVLNREGKTLCNRSVENDAETIHGVMSVHGTPRRVAIEACCGAANLVRQREDTKLRLRGLLRENRLKCLTANAWT